MSWPAGGSPTHARKGLLCCAALAPAAAIGQLNADARAAYGDPLDLYPLDLQRFLSAMNERRSTNETIYLVVSSPCVPLVFDPSAEQPGLAHTAGSGRVSGPQIKG